MTMTIKYKHITTGRIHSRHLKQQLPTIPTPSLSFNKSSFSSSTIFFGGCCVQYTNDNAKADNKMTYLIATRIYLLINNTGERATFIITTKFFQASVKVRRSRSEMRSYAVTAYFLHFLCNENNNKNSRNVIVFVYHFNKVQTSSFIFLDKLLQKRKKID